MHPYPFTLVEQAKSLSADFDQNFVALGKVLTQLRDISAADMKQFCNEAGISTRKAYYLIALTKKIEPLNIPAADLAQIGWTKLVVIAKVLTADNWQGHFALALISTTRDLTNTMKGVRPTPGMRSMVLFFKPDDYAKFAKSVLAHGAKQDGAHLLYREDALLRIFDKLEATK